MTRIEKSIEIKAPPEKVWEMLALDRFPEWMDDLISSEYITEVYTPEDKYKVGTSAHWTRVKQGEFDLEITESVENEKITVSSKGRHVMFLCFICLRFYASCTMTYLLKPVEKGTKLASLRSYEVTWGILGQFLAKLFAQRTTEKESEKSLEKLKSILEKWGDVLCL